MRCQRAGQISNQRGLTKAGRRSPGSGQAVVPEGTEPVD